MNCEGSDVLVISHFGDDYPCEKDGSGTFVIYNDKKIPVAKMNATALRNLSVAIEASLHNMDASRQPMFDWIAEDDDEEQREYRLVD
tara:strand:- start:109 stop:369 length:261 start_codon:yes stop_codon:yes gene_type:complete